MKLFLGVGKLVALVFWLAVLGLDFILTALMFGDF